ncbi:MAG: hypothetical protein J6B92_03010 [Paraprevotella sp.]|nr:hypothetical protein [Paraprevotella sp.]
MDKILIILPYFGKFDSLFPYWLKSCECNKDINFLIVTNDKTQYDYPHNVKVVYQEFAQLYEKIQSLYDFPISLEAPYRLCNFKPAYGEIFKEYINGYDYWGFSDCDMLFGDLRKFLPSDYEKYDKIGAFGHLSLIKNTPENNSLYRCNDAYKIAFSVDRPLFFDEDTFPYILKKYGKLIYSLKILDFMPRLKRFEVLNDDMDSKRNVFIFENGKVVRYCLCRNEVRSAEYAYIHFLKRPITIALNTLPNKFLIAENGVWEYQPITKELIAKYTHNGIFWNYWKNSFRWKNFKDRLCNRLWRNKEDRKLIEQMKRMIDEKDSR